MKNKKWTFIDTLIVLIIAAIAAVGVMMLKPSTGTKAEKEKISFTVLIQNKDKELAEAIAPGAKAVLSLTEKDSGTVTDVVTKNAVHMTFNSLDGTYANVETEDKVDIYVTIDADCEISEKSIKTGGTTIKVGAELPVRGKGFATSGYVIGIDD